jgi:hypothetical protein
VRQTNNWLFLKFLYKYYLLFIYYYN